MKKIFLFSLGFVIFGTSLFGQIALPDVVTEIETESEVAEASALPDFENVLEPLGGSTNIEPELPDMEIQESTVAVAVQGNPENKIYAEGKLGGGFPSMIYGDFSVYELNETSPFKISFTHDSATGYGANSLTDGFNDSTTVISVEKGITYKNFEFSLDGSYSAFENGLQSKVDEINEVAQNYYSANGTFSWKLPKGFSIGAAAGAGYYNRFADLTTASQNSDMADWVKQYGSFNFTPDFTANWTNGSFNVDFLAKYSLNTEFEVVNRGEFTAGFFWKNDYVKLFTEGSVVCGNKLNGNQALIPFKAGINSTIPVKFATRRMSINGEGGLKSYRNSISDYETLYHFTGFDFDPTETSDWYGVFEFVLPIKSSFSANAKIAYNQTAFNNGIWEPDYSENGIYYGIYTFEQKERKALTTDFGFAFNYKIFNMGAGWHSNWLDVPVLESKNMVDVNLALQSSNNKWTIGLLSGFYIDEELQTPLFNLNGMFKVTDQVQLLASVDDIVNLCTGGVRVYAGQYGSRSGSASFMVKFFF